jgi:hypothetical protein
VSRSGYIDYDENDPGFARWRGAVSKAINGRRGQAFLREMLAALDAMPEKELIAAELVSEDGAVCAIGAICKARGMDVSNIDEGDGEDVGDAVGIARAMAMEIAYINDECGPAKWQGEETPAQRFERVRRWVVAKLKVAP